MEKPPRSRSRSRLTPETTSRDERTLLRVLARNGEIISVTDAAKAGWPGKRAEGDAEPEHTGKGARGKARKTPLSAYRRVVNAARRLTRDGLMDRPEPGHYRLTEQGRTFVAALPE